MHYFQWDSVHSVPTYAIMPALLRVSTKRSIVVIAAQGTEDSTDLVTIH